MTWRRCRSLQLERVWSAGNATWAVASDLLTVQKGYSSSSPRTEAMTWFPTKPARKTVKNAFFSNDKNKTRIQYRRYNSVYVFVHRFGNIQFGATYIIQWLIVEEQRTIYCVQNVMSGHRCIVRFHNDRRQLPKYDVINVYLQPRASTSNWQPQVHESRARSAITSHDLVFTDFLKY